MCAANSGAKADNTNKDPLLRIYAQLRQARAEAYDRQANAALSDEDVRIMDEGFYRFEKRGPRGRASHNRGRDCGDALGS